MSEESGEWQFPPQDPAGVQAGAQEQAGRQAGDGLMHLSDHGAAQAERLMRHLRDYWHAIRRGRPVPSRMDVDPAGIGPALDYSFLLERIGPGAARFRLTGQHLIDLTGREMRGLPICALLNPSSRGRFSDVLESVFSGPQLAEFALESPAEYGRPLLEARMLILPLRSDLDDVTRALGCLIAQGRHGVVPRRFDLRQDRVHPLFAGGAVTRPSPSAQPPARQREFAEAMASFQHRPDGGQTPMPQAAPDRSDPAARRAMFRVVTDDPGNDSKR